MLSSMPQVRSSWWWWQNAICHSIVVLFHLWPTAADGVVPSFSPASKSQSGSVICKGSTCSAEICFGGPDSRAFTSPSRFVMCSNATAQLTATPGTAATAAAQQNNEAQCAGCVWPTPLPTAPPVCVLCVCAFHSAGC